MWWEWQGSRRYGIESIGAKCSQNSKSANQNFLWNERISRLPMFILLAACRSMSAMPSAKKRARKGSKLQPVIMSCCAVRTTKEQGRLTYLSSAMGQMMGCSGRLQILGKKRAGRDIGKLAGGRIVRVRTELPSSADDAKQTYESLQLSAHYSPLLGEGACDAIHRLINLVAPSASSVDTTASQKPGISCRGVSMYG